MKLKVRLPILFLILWMLFSSFPISCYAESISVSAKSALLMDASSGKVLYQKDAFVKLPMASTTKIMTAVVATENTELTSIVEISPDATGIEGSSIYLYPGEKLTMEDLLYALLLESANDAASAIAIAVAEDESSFADMMNEKASELGLKSTHFENPHGLDSEEHYTTAYDLAKLTSYALSLPQFKTICSTYKKNIPLKVDEGIRVLVNHNKMLKQYDGAIGVKTGFTKKSGRCLVSAAERDGLTLVAVTLRAPDDWSDHTAMLNYGFSRYRHIVYAEKESYLVKLPVVGGTTASVNAVNATAIEATLSTDRGELVCRIEGARFLYAPVKKGDVVGRIVCLSDGEEIASSDLIITEDIAPSKPRGFFGWLLSLFQKK